MTTEPRTAIVLKGYPRLSETFIAQEIRALESKGVRLLIVSLRHPTDQKRHAVHAEIVADVLYLPEYLHQEPLRVLRAVWRALRTPGLLPAVRAWWQDLRRDPTRNRVRRFGQAMVLAVELPGDVNALHAHFLHTPGSVTRYAAMMLGWPWSFSAHAKDIWTTPAWEKREKLADCAWGVTCTRTNLEHLRSLCANPGKLALLYHGLNLDRFDHHERLRSCADGANDERKVQILSVGRAVEKKGYDVLLEALAELPQDLAWHFSHIGGGPLIGRLREHGERLGLNGRVSWLGPQSQERVIAQYRAADLFVLASRTAADGDRDGLPNVLVEAQSQALACVSTRVSAIPELIDDGFNGRLVEANDAPALACALSELIKDPKSRERMGRNGEQRVRERFSLEPGIAALKARLRSGCEQHA